MSFNRVVAAVRQARGFEEKLRAGLRALVLGENGKISKPKCIALALLIGYLSHLILDAFTPKGYPVASYLG